MIEGIGLDLIEVHRVQKILLRQQRLSERILTDNEHRIYESLKPARQLEFLAGRFAAKEAYAKASGTGIGQLLSWKDIEVITGESGRPSMRVHSSTHRIYVSITHTKGYAAAQVVIENE